MVRTKTLAPRPPMPSDDSSDSEYIAISSGDDSPSPPARAAAPSRRYFTRLSATWAGARRRPSAPPARRRPLSPPAAASPPRRQRPRTRGGLPSVTRRSPPVAPAAPSPPHSPDSGHASSPPLSPEPSHHSEPASIPAASIQTHQSPPPATTPARDPSPSPIQQSPVATPSVPTPPSPAPPSAASPSTAPPSVTPPRPPAQRPAATVAPIPGNADCSSREFQDEQYYDFRAFMQSPQTRDGTEICRAYFLEPFMIPRPFIYTRIIRAFYQTMTTRGVSHPTEIHFQIDGRDGVLTADSIAEALGIPVDPPVGTVFVSLADVSASEKVAALAQGPTAHTAAILRRELPPHLWLVDHVLRSNLFPCQHVVQRRGELLDALYRISQRAWFSPAHLVIAALVYFEDKVHVKKLSRAHRLPLILPRLLSTVLEYLGYVSVPDRETKRHCREVFTLHRWQAVNVSRHSISGGASLSASTEHHYTPPASLRRDLMGDGPDSPVHETTPCTAPATDLQSPPPTGTASAAPSTVTPGAPSSAGSSHIVVPATDFVDLCTQVHDLRASQAQMMFQLQALTALLHRQQTAGALPDQVPPFIPPTAPTAMPPPSGAEDPAATPGPDAPSAPQT